MEIDVVVVAYRSAAHLRSCVEPLCGQPDMRVIVVDNACPEDSTSTIAHLPITVVAMGRNAGFAAGCNAGARAGSGEGILFLNPDAKVTPVDVRVLAARLAQNPSVGALGPRLVEANGRTERSIRRVPRLRSAFGEALFLHRVFRQADWPTEFVRRGYERACEAEWLIGAVLLVRRSAFESIGGFDERFFLYSEDVDLCTRLRRRGFAVRYDPAVIAQHEGGGSSPGPHQPALRAEARVLYASLHEHRLRYAAFRIACAIHELLRLSLALMRSRRAVWPHVAALRVALGGSAPRPPGEHKDRRPSFSVGDARDDLGGLPRNDGRIEVGN